jgi:hypothetical protein
MGTKQNSSQELDLYPKFNPMIISSNLVRPTNYRQSIGPQNRVRNLELPQKTNLDTSRNETGTCAESELEPKSRERQFPADLSKTEVYSQ